MRKSLWQEVEEIFYEAVNLADGDRYAFAAARSGANQELFEEVSSLLRVHQESAGFLEEPVFADGMRLLEEGDSAEFLAKEFLSRYKLVKLIGHGGMGTVFLADDQKLNRPVALKILPKHLAGQTEFIARFRQEARAASSINHPNVTHIYEFDREQGRHFLVMEYVAGRTLREILKSEKISARQAVIYAIQIAKGLAAAHRQGIIHRDIKPENIMVTGDNHVKILDFGLAKIGEFTEDSHRALIDASLDTTPGLIIGTTGYMSPEQVRAQKLDQRTDIWSLGVVLYEMVFGERPFSGATPSDIQAAILLAETPPPDALAADTKLSRVINRALQKDAAERYQNADEFLAGLQECLPETSDIHLARPTAETKKSVESAARNTQPVSRRAKIAGAISLLVLLSAAFAVWKYSAGFDADAQNLKITKSERVTNRGRAVRGAVSPDGNYLVYALEENGAQGLYLINNSPVKSVNGSEVKIILPPAERRINGLIFAPDSRSVFFTSRETGENASSLYRLALENADEPPQRIVREIENAPDFSPDGKRIAFLRFGHDQSFEEICLADAADGANEKVLYTRRMPDYISHQTQPAWSPDGKTIIIAGGTYKNDRQETFPFAIDAETGAARPLFENSWEEIWQIDWLPDQRGFIFTGRDTGNYDNKQLWLASYPNGKVTRLTEDYNDYFGVSVYQNPSDRTTRIMSIVLQRTAQIWKVNLDEAPDKNLLQITSEGNNGLGLSLSTAGDDIFFGSMYSGNPDIWTISGSENKPRQLTFDTNLDVNPIVARDGRTIVFASQRSGIKTLWRMNADGSGQTPILKKATVDNFALAPDSRTIFYYSYFDGQGALWRADIDGQSVEKIVEGLYESPAVSPDGKNIAAVYKESKEKDEVIAVWNLAAGIASIRKIKPLEGAQLPGALRWSPDNQSLLYVVSKKGVNNLWSQPISGGEAKQITNFTSDRIFAFDLSDDGRRIVCSRGKVDGYAVLLAGE